MNVWRQRGIWVARLAVVVGALPTLIPASTRAADPAAPPSFTPGDISIGEPVALPFAPAPSRPVPAAAPTTAAAAPAPVRVPEVTSPTPTAIPGTGWLGLSVAESNVPGRWRVDDVTAAGPAARAGILPGDELRAVNGTEFKSLDEVTQAITSIAAGQDVRVALARADQIRDLSLRAEPRPPAAGRGWQSAPETTQSTAGPAVNSVGPADQRFAGADVRPLPVEFPQAPLNAAIPQVAIPQVAIPQVAIPQVAIPQAPRFGGVVAAPPESPASPPASPFAAAPTSAAPAVTVEPGRLAASESLPAPVLPAPAAGPAAAAPGPRGRTALGVRTLPIDAVTQARFNLPRPAGAYVVGVVQDLPASKAGVPPGSVIVSLGDRPVRSPLELAEMVTTGPVDRPTTLEFVLPGGQSRRAEVVLQSLEAPLERALVGGAEPATAVPALEPGPTPARAERPVTFDPTLLRDEIRRLRTRLDQLERTLEASAR